MTAEKFMLLVPVIGAVIPLDVGPVWELVTRGGLVGALVVGIVWLARRDDRRQERSETKLASIIEANTKALQRVADVIDGCNDCKKK